MCLAPKNSYLSRRTYFDTSVELEKVRMGLTSSRTNFKCIRAAKEPSKKHKCKLRVIQIQIRVKHNVTVRSLSEFWIIEILSPNQLTRH